MWFTTVSCPATWWMSMCRWVTTPATKRTTRYPASAARCGSTTPSARQPCMLTIWKAACLWNTSARRSQGRATASSSGPTWWPPSAMPRRSISRPHSASNSNRGRRLPRQAIWIWFHRSRSTARRPPASRSMAPPRWPTANSFTTPNAKTITPTRSRFTGWRPWTRASPPRRIWRSSGRSICANTPKPGQQHFPAMSR